MDIDEISPVENSIIGHAEKEAAELYPDLASYIRANKVIACPKEDIDPEYAAVLEHAQLEMRSDSFGTVYFVDSEGSVATFKLTDETVRKIESIPRGQEEGRVAALKELEDNGFKYAPRGDDVYRAMFNAVRKYQEGMAEQAKQNRRPIKW